VIDKVIQSLTPIFQQLTQGRIRPNQIVVGTSPQHLNEAGWITIFFFDRTNNPQPFSGRGGSSPINGSSTGYLILGVTDISETRYYCSQLGAGLIFHELGHCLGLGHTTNVDTPNMMAGGIGCAINETHYSSLEKYHAQIMYSRHRNNQYPDTDPESFSF
jgi:hypothetical protein